MMFVTICHRKIKTLEKSRVLDKLMTGIGLYTIAFCSKPVK